MTLVFDCIEEAVDLQVRGNKIFASLRCTLSRSVTILVQDVLYSDWLCDICSEKHDKRNMTMSSAYRGGRWEMGGAPQATKIMCIWFELSTFERSLERHSETMGKR